MSLSYDELLAKCLHGKTQNNESINNILWKVCPKDIYVGQTTLSTDVDRQGTRRERHMDQNCVKLFVGNL